MSESIIVENKKPNRQRPPLSFVRITGEILVGTILCIVALLVVYAINVMLFGISDFTGSIGGLHAFGSLVIFIIFFPPLYVIGSALGVYLVGNIDKQAGSLLVTSGGGLLGLFVISIFIFCTIGGSSVRTPEQSVGAAEKIVMWGRLLPILLSGPIMATLGFNLTRRYEIQEKRTSIAKSVARTTLMVLAVCSIVPIWMYGSDIGFIGFIIPVILFILALVLK